MKSRVRGDSAVQDRTSTEERKSASDLLQVASIDIDLVSPGSDPTRFLGNEDPGALRICAMHFLSFVQVPWRLQRRSGLEAWRALLLPSWRVSFGTR